ncbi:hypothetical protein BACI349Y_620097 [Bacillus sp. 349Y]|nr:hypothetical protein BACI349Y_620097 [Bacillus sp. 349Y]
MMIDAGRDNPTSGKPITNGIMARMLMWLRERRDRY